MSKDDAKAFFEEKDRELVEKVCELLKGYEDAILLYISDFVASVCGVDKGKMLTDCDKIYIAQARWLYWYAIRYMTNDTYEKIADRTALRGHRFASSSIGLCINKMSQLIEREPVWMHRWNTLKVVIKVWMDDNTRTTNTMPTKVVISCPKDCNIKFDIKKE